MMSYAWIYCVTFNLKEILQFIVRFLMSMSAYARINIELSKGLRTLSEYVLKLHREL